MEAGVELQAASAESNRFGVIATVERKQSHTGIEEERMRIERTQPLIPLEAPGGFFQVSEVSVGDGGEAPGDWQVGVQHQGALVKLERLAGLLV